MECYNCGLPNARLKARVTLTWITEAKPYTYRCDGGKTTVPSKVELRSPSRRWLDFCNEECAAQTMYLQRNRSSRVGYAKFRSSVPIERLDRYEMGSQVVDSTERKNSETGLLTPSINPEFRNAGRPQKWLTDAEKQRAYRKRKRLRLPFA